MAGFLGAVESWHANPCSENDNTSTNGDKEGIRRTRSSSFVRALSIIVKKLCCSYIILLRPYLEYCAEIWWPLSIRMWRPMKGWRRDSPGIGLYWSILATSKGCTNMNCFYWSFGSWGVIWHGLMDHAALFYVLYSCVNVKSENDTMAELESKPKAVIFCC